MQYTVTATIQGGNIDDNQPVEVKWYSGPSEAQAIVAMGQAATCYTDPDNILPSSVRVRTLSVRLDIEHPEQKGADGAVVGVLDEKAHPSPFSVSHPPAVTDDTTYYMDEFEGLPEKPTLLTFDSESHDYSLSDCVYRDNYYTDDCAGPRIGLASFSNGFVAIMCEHHANS